MNIIVNTRFSATHCWPTCPIEEVKFLRHPHRHEFHVKLKTKVLHNDRDIELIQLKNSVEKWISENWDKKYLSVMSCEDMCEILSTQFNLDYVCVLEDGENGAEYFKGI